LSNDIG